MWRRLFILALLLAPTCKAESPSDRAARTLVARERALNEKNLELYLSAISRNYAGSPNGYERMRVRAEGLFRTVDVIRYTSFQRTMYEEPGRVRVVQRYTMDLVRNGEKKTLAGQEQLILAEEDGQYRIIDGL